jgi:hypothetical protein
LNPKRSVVSILIAICVTGAIGIPLGNPKFIIPAISLELIFISLTILSIKKIRYTLIPNIIIGIIIIIGNTVSPQHIDIMSSFTPFGNAIILIIGGYILQSMLIFSSIISLKNGLLHAK